MSQRVRSEQDLDLQRGVGLTADCDRCCGLCCVATAFAASPEFAFDKAAGTACPHLGESFQCVIHATLRAEGLSGCVAFDCYGAGQKVTEVTFGGANWQEEPQIAEQMFAAFGTMRQLHTLLMHLAQALELPAAEPMHGELAKAYDAIEGLTQKSAAELQKIDVSTCKSEVHALLVRVSRQVRVGRERG